MVVDDNVKQVLLTYYDERAEEYDDIYLGLGHLTLDPDLYKKDVAEVSEMVSGFGKGHLIDIGCGPGFWTPSYAKNCKLITFLDQSKSMLSKCRDRIEKLGLTHMSNFILGDFFDVNFKTATYDCALTGFFLSHLTLEQESACFWKFKKILKPNSKLMFIDSAWNQTRQQYQQKEGVQERVLKDGRIFKIYKRYFEIADIEEMYRRNNLKINTYYIGQAMIAAIGEYMVRLDL